MEDEKEFYDKFKKELSNVQELPGDYVFKFILESKNNEIAKLQKIFDGARPKISSKASKSEKYTSFTIKVYVLDEDEIINYYKKASQIKGIISL